MLRIMFISTLFTEKFVVDIIINDRQHTPKLKLLLVLEQSLNLGSVDQELHQY
jgi:hypothetical protein